jgi:hypothetical protein
MKRPVDFYTSITFALFNPHTPPFSAHFQYRPKTLFTQSCNLEDTILKFSPPTTSRGTATKIFRIFVPVQNMFLLLIGKNFFLTQPRKNQSHECHSVCPRRPIHRRGKLFSSYSRI